MFVGEVVLGCWFGAFLIMLLDSQAAESVIVLVLVFLNVIGARILTNIYPVYSHARLDGSHP